MRCVWLDTEKNWNWLFMQFNNGMADGWGGRGDRGWRRVLRFRAKVRDMGLVDVTWWGNAHSRTGSGGVGGGLEVAGGGWVNRFKFHWMTVYTGWIVGFSPCSIFSRQPTTWWWFIRYEVFFPYLFDISRTFGKFTAGVFYWCECGFVCCFFFLHFDEELTLWVLWRWIEWRIDNWCARVKKIVNFFGHEKILWNMRCCYVPLFVVSLRYCTFLFALKNSIFNTFICFIHPKLEVQDETTEFNYKSRWKHRHRIPA